MTIMIVDNDCDGYDCQQCDDHDGYDVVNNHGVAISYDHLHSPSVIGLLARFFLQSWAKILTVREIFCVVATKNGY